MSPLFVDVVVVLIAMWCTADVQLHVLTLRHIYRRIHAVKVVLYKQKKLFITDWFLTKNILNCLGYSALLWRVV